MARGGSSSSGGGCGGADRRPDRHRRDRRARRSRWRRSSTRSAGCRRCDAIWADCDGDCALAHRFPGFWWHVVVNLAYTAFALFVLFGFGSTVRELRKARLARYDSAAAMQAFREAHSACRGMGQDAGRARRAPAPRRDRLTLMRAPAIDRDDPDVRARLAVRDFERRERTTRIAKALGLFALAGLGPLARGARARRRRRPSAAVLASLLFLGGGVGASGRGRGRRPSASTTPPAAIWAQIRPTAGDDTPWTRYGAWAIARRPAVELVLVSRRGTAEEATRPRRSR